MSQPRDPTTGRGDPFGPSGRMHRRRQKFGASPRCALCGCEDIQILSYQRVPRSIIEEHHVVGRAHDPELVVLLCRNCHARVSARQVDAGVDLKPKTNVLEWLIGMLRNIAVLCGELAPRIREWADYGDRLVAGLDHDFPGWRDKPWARR